MAGSFGNAWSGLTHVYTTQRNMRIHVLFAAFAGAVCIFLGVSGLEVVLVFVAVAAVFVAEITNTFAESLIDLMRPDFNRLSKTAKDVAAAGVLLTSLFSLVIGAVVFVPPLREIRFRFQDFLSNRATVFAVYVAATVFPALLGLWKGRR